MISRRREGLYEACGMVYIPLFWVAIVTMFRAYSTSVGLYCSIASSCCFRSNSRNFLKNRAKSLVGSDFICTFARYLCVMRPRVHKPRVQKRALRPAATT